MAFAHRNALAKRLRSLHVPGSPILLTNCYDGATASIVCEHPGTKAIATASYAVAETSGVKDAELSLENNISSIKRVANVVERYGLPLTADMQDGYADVKESIRRVIEAGAVGCNIEDSFLKTGELRSLEDAVERIREAVEAAKELGVPDFCVNARTDSIACGYPIEEAIKRGKAFLDAGALTVFVWGGPKGRGLRDAEIKQLVEAFGGMLNVKMNLREGYLNKQEIGELGVSRISIGPELYLKAMAAFRENLDGAVGGGA